MTPIQLVRSRKAVVLYSGGLDSLVVLMWALKQGYECYPLCFDYGQSNAVEINAAEAQIDWYRARYAKVKPLLVCEIPGYAKLAPQCVMFGGEGSFGSVEAITVPNRLMVFGSLGVSYTTSVGAQTLILGLQTEEPSDGFEPVYDSTREHLLVLQGLGRYYSERAPREEFVALAPLLEVGKVEIWEAALRWGLPVETARSCLQGKIHCGTCSSCKVTPWLAQQE